MDNGELYFSLSAFPNSSSRAYHIIGYDTVNDSVKLSQRAMSLNSGNNGFLTSLVRGTQVSGNAGFLYFGGSLEQATNRWHLGVLKLDVATQQMKLFKIAYSDASGGCTPADDGYDKLNTAKYASHLGFMSDSVGSWLFGITQEHSLGSVQQFDPAGGSIMTAPIVFRVAVDSTGDLGVQAGDLRMKILSKTPGDAYVLGMKPQMDLNSGKYFIHVIVGVYKSGKNIYHGRLTTDSTQDRDLQMISGHHN